MVRDYQNKKYDPQSTEAKVTLWVVVGLVAPVVIMLLTAMDIVSSKPTDLDPGSRAVRGVLYQVMEDNHR